MSFHFLIDFFLQITFIQNELNDNILSALDTEAGSWMEGEVNYAEKLTNIANRCIEVKLRSIDGADTTLVRPDMVTVRNDLKVIYESLNCNKLN